MSRTPVFAIIGLMLTLAPAWTMGETLGSAQPVCPATSGNYWESERCAEAALLAARPELGVRRGARLALRLDDGRWVSVLDQNPEGADPTLIQRHVLVAAFNAPRLFVIVTALYEGAALSVMSRANGQRWQVGGSAVAPSPDGTRLIAWGAAGGYDEGALEVWRLEGGRLHLEFRGKTAPASGRLWWPASVRWLDDARIEFVREEGEDPDRRTSARRNLVRDDSGGRPSWRIAPVR